MSEIRKYINIVEMALLPSGSIASAPLIAMLTVANSGGGLSKEELKEEVIKLLNRGAESSSRIEAQMW